MKSTICLNMIVKNEAHIITELFNTIWQYINYYVIIDTGSTDDTKKVIKDFFDLKGINGEIIDHEYRTCLCHDQSYKRYNFFHFGWNRTYALQQCINKSDYIWIMDADDLLVPNDDFKLPEPMEKDSYFLQLGLNNRYIKPLIIRNNSVLGWKFIGGLHEYLYSNMPHTKMILKGNYYVESRRLGDRSKTVGKYLKDAKVFEELLLEEPSNDRYLFYCGQSYHDGGDYINSIKYYKKRISLFGMNSEETFYAKYRIAICKILLNCSEKDVLDSLWDCFICRPFRAEPIYRIVFYCKQNKKYEDGYRYGKYGIHLKCPGSEVYIVERDVYDYKLMGEIAVCAYFTGRFKEAHDLWNKMLTESKLLDTDRLGIEHNFNVVKNKLNSKPILCFYIDGNTDIITDLSKQLEQYYQIFIFGKTNLNTFLTNNIVDILIIFQHIDFFLEFKSTARKTYLWTHDGTFKSDNKYILINNLGNIDNIIVPNDSHKKLIIESYNIPGSKIKILNNKIKNKFVYIAISNKEFVELVNLFPKVINKLPDAKLIIFKNNATFNDTLISQITKKYKFITIKTNNDDTVEDLKNADYVLDGTKFSDLDKIKNNTQEWLQLFDYETDIINKEIDNLPSNIIIKVISSGKVNSFAKFAKNAGIHKFNRIDKIDHKIIKWNYWFEKLFGSPDNLIDPNIINHVELWRDICRKSDNIIYLIINDTVNFVDGFANYLNNVDNKNWDILIIGFDDIKNNSGNVLDEYVGKYELDENDGLNCYCINKRGARKMLELAYKNKINHSISKFIKSNLEQLCVYRTNKYLTFNYFDNN